MVGQTVGHYEILDVLGEGGMGKVYRAHDTRLDRQVALKVLPLQRTSSRERLERFRREARTLASLNHPNIVTVFSVEEVEGVHFLTMELLEGETLADYVPPGGVPLRELFRLAIDLADALAAAHDAGVVHRDLKPTNVFVTLSGRIKILDFGLAKLIPGEAVGGDSASPTEALTAEGRILGTVPFMSPEQLDGQPPDRRSDLFSLGIILYQLATGRRPFKGQTSAAMISSIMQDIPPPIDELRSGLPHHLALVVGMCLEKEPDERFQSAKDLRNELSILSRDVASSGAAPPGAGRRRFRRAAGWSIGAAAVLLLLVGAFAASRFAARDRPATSLRIPMAVPEGLRPALGYGRSVAISRDGRHIAFALESSAGPALYLKGPDDLEPRRVAGTDGARTPFFSPDARWIAFFDEHERQLKKVSVGGGEPIPIAPADYQWGGAWAADGTIVFSSIYSGLMRVPAAGGRPTPITHAGAFQHSWPSLLPGDKSVLFTILASRGSFDKASIAIVPLSGGEPKIVFDSAYYPHYTSTGHLVFVQKGSLVAAPFDLGRLRIDGPVADVLDDVWTSPWTGYADLAFSDSGTLLYVAGGPDRSRATLQAVDRHGVATPILEEPLPYTTPRISPDGRQIAFAIGDQEVDLWLYDLDRERLSRFTDSPSWDAYAQWQPGSPWVAFSSMRDGLPAIYRKGVRTEAVERLVATGHPTYPLGWTPGGELLAYVEEHPLTGLDLWLYSIDDGNVRPLLRTGHNETGAAFSPDGRFLAYESDESGRGYEVYIRPYPDLNPAVKVSTRGGRTPRWGHGGTELFYLSGGSMMAVELELHSPSQLVAGTPRVLFSGSYGRQFDVSPDGRWFAMIDEAAENARPLRIHFVANWFDELERLSAARR